MVLPIRLQDFYIKYISRTKWRNSLLFACWYRKLRVDRKLLGWVWLKMSVATLVTGLLNWLYVIKESIRINWFFLMVIQMQDIANNWVGMIKSGHDPLYGTLKSAVYNNEWMNWANFLYDYANLGKLKITLIIFGWLWLKMGMGL